MSGPVLRVVSDKASVVTYLNRQGDTVYQDLSCLSEQILITIHRRSVFVISRHSTGDSNVVADLFGRPNSIVNTEWTLRSSVLSLF